MISARLPKLTLLVNFEGGQRAHLSRERGRHRRSKVGQQLRAALIFRARTLMRKTRAQLQL